MICLALWMSLPSPTRLLPPCVATSVESLPSRSRSYPDIIGMGLQGCSHDHGPHGDDPAVIPWLVCLSCLSCPPLLVSCPSLNCLGLGLSPATSKSKEGKRDDLPGTHLRRALLCSACAFPPPFGSSWWPFPAFFGQSPAENSFRLAPAASSPPGHHPFPPSNKNHLPR